MSAGAADLIADYRRALQNDPQLREAEANRLAAIEAKVQAVLLLRILASSSALRKHDSGASSTTVSLLSEPGGAPVGQVMASTARRQRSATRTA